MIYLLGIKNKTSIEIRERFHLSHDKQEIGLIKLNNVFDEVVILSTCNRTEIYITSEIEKNRVKDIIFDILKWDKTLMNYTFISNEEKAVKHIMKVACGFHSKILGEDQILGQIKKSYYLAKENGTVNSNFMKLFEYSIRCGKEFRHKCKLYNYPVSVASITIKDCVEKQIKSYMIVGYGEIGKLVTKYILQLQNIDKLYIVSRNVEKLKSDNIIKCNDKIKVIHYDEKKYYYQKVDCIITCTSAPHPIVKKNEFKKSESNKKIYIYDLGIPRNVEEKVKQIFNVIVFDIDDLSYIDEVNKNKRKQVMYDNINIIDMYMQNFLEWQNIREISPYIKKIKENSNHIYEQRYKTFINKKQSKPPEELVHILLKSVSDVYVNRSIEVLKEEKIMGHEKECLRILNKIFGL